MSSDQALLKPKNGTGRDLPKAILVAIILAAMVITSLVYSQLWYPFIAVAAAIAMWEVTSRLYESGFVLPRLLLILSTQTIIWPTYTLGGLGVLYGLIPTLIILYVVRLFQQESAAPGTYTRDISMGTFLLIWIPVFASCATMLINTQGISGPALLATMFLCVAANDIGGYAAGIFAGSHPMAPSISPKKSWEGFSGSLVAGMIVGALCAEFLLHVPLWQGIVLGLVLVVTATLGDLIESQFKRDLGIKDMSSLLPGHGGLMDRLDGLLPSVAMMWLIVTAIF